MTNIDIQSSNSPGHAQQTLLPIIYPADASDARRRAKVMALTLGFDTISSEEIAITVSELTSNLLKHAQGGTLILTSFTEGAASGLIFETFDHGQGIRDIERAFTDGFSTKGSLGYGLGTINRLMDQVTIESEPGKGTHVRCVRYLRLDADSCALPLPRYVLDIGVASRAFPGYTDNGDAFVTKQWHGGSLVGVIDGVGHGQSAELASRAARQYVEKHHTLPLQTLFTGTHRACHSTRGVVMALARLAPIPHIAPHDPVMTLSFASIGNIETRLVGGAEHANLLVKRGIIGMANAMPKVLVCEHYWYVDQIMILHSDGIHANWHWNSLPCSQTTSAETLAHHLLANYARENDDATVAVIKGAIQA